MGIRPMRPSALLGVLDRLGRHTPTVLVLEDLHWADASTRDLLACFVRNVRDAALAVIGTYRSDDLHRRHPLRPVLAELERSAVVERIDLPRFDREELGEVIDSILSGPAPAGLVDRAFERSDGNAFFAEELLAADAVDDRVPESLREIVLARIDALPARTTHGRGVGASPPMPAPSPLDRVAWPRATARLAIRAATADDVEATWRFRRLPEVSRWITRAPRTVDEYAVDFLDEDSLGRTLVVERAGEVVGDLMLKVGDAWAQAEVAEEARGVEAELGWTLHPDHAGRGYAAEAVTELLHVCFDELGIRRVVAACFAGNERSSRLMERLGMRREATFVRDSLHRSGAWMDSLQYALLADEWRGDRREDVAVPRSR